MAPQQLARMRRSRTAAVLAGAAGSLEGSLARFVDLIWPHLPPGLVGLDRVSHIRAAVRNVPAELVACFGFECRIDIEAPDAGILFSADAETGGLQMLAGRHPLVQLPRQLSEADSWAPVIRFCAQREPSALLDRATADVRAELALQSGYEPSPNFSFGLRLAGSPEASRRPLGVLVRTLELGLEALAGERRPASAAIAPALGSLLQRLPETARVARAGSVDGQPGAVRLWLARMTRGEIVDLVEFGRERREPSAIDRVLDDVIAPNVIVGPRVDVGTAVGPRARMSCSVDGAGSPLTVAMRWEPLLDRLVAHSLCTSDKRDALLHASGLLREHDSVSWPEHLTRLSQLDGARAQSVVSWRLEHVDVHCDRGKPVAATASILASHEWSTD